MHSDAQRKLSLIDVLVTRKENGTLGHTVHRKATQTNRYLKGNSHHHPAQLKSVVKTLTTRSKQLADEEHIDTELESLRYALQQNQFSLPLINKIINQERNSPRDNTEKENRKAFLPYIVGTTDKISKLLQKYIKPIFTTNRKISNILSNPKDEIELEHQGIYEIPCGNCPQTYVGCDRNRKTPSKYEQER